MFACNRPLQGAILNFFILDSIIFFSISYLHLQFSRTVKDIKRKNISAKPIPLILFHGHVLKIKGVKFDWHYVCKVTSF